MDWNAAIEINREALKRVLAMLVAMAGLEDRPATLPRHLHRAVLGLLRPAEAAVRRLIIAAARGIVVALPPAYQRKPKPQTTEPVLRRFGIAVVVSPADLAGMAAARRAGDVRAAVVRAARPRALSLPLFDPLPGLLSLSKGRERRRYVPAYAAPRISGLDLGATLRRLPSPPSPDDPVDAARLALRIEALASALDDLPAQARRFARRRARAAQAGRRRWPLRPGRPPGGRRRHRHEIHEILSAVHGLAFWALQPNTS